MNLERALAESLSFDLKSSARGASCVFISDGRTGLKCYRNDREGALAWAAQSLAAEHGLGPKVIGFPFLHTFDQWTGAVFGTQLAGRTPFPFRGFTDFVIRFEKVFGALPGDIGQSNFGLIRGHLVMVDFGRGCVSSRGYARLADRVADLPWQPTGCLCRQCLVAPTTEHYGAR
jgi:hypothetical protein